MLSYIYLTCIVLVINLYTCTIYKKKLKKSSMLIPVDIITIIMTYARICFTPLTNHKTLWAEVRICWRTALHGLNSGLKLKNFTILSVFRTGSKRG